ncbi:MAG: AbrB/MazE/SpoVT family DNA-binding domain-containing protein [Ruminococcaceae bacterium]|nr:AbrB/MazE/SpoVT family DNA-binding domain-containing protein [Oscillospiraceae bacterium]
MSQQWSRAFFGAWLRLRAFLFSKGGLMMEYGVVRKLDRLGRLIVAKDLRNLYNIHPETTVVLIPTKDGILVKRVDETKK